MTGTVDILAVGGDYTRVQFVYSRALNCTAADNYRPTI